MYTQREKIKTERLAHYSGRQPRAFVQYDGFCNVGEDDVMRPDQDGDSCMGGATYELMSGVCQVRVLITAGTSDKDALRLLKKIRNWIKRDGFGQLGLRACTMADELEYEYCPRCGERKDLGHSYLCGIKSLTDEQVQEVLKAQIQVEEIPF